MSTILNYPDIVLGSLLAVFMLFASGFLLIRYFLYELNIAYRLVLAFPMGLLFWSVIWIISILSTGSTDFGFFNSANVISLATATLSIPLLYFLSVKRLRFSLSEIVHLCFGTATLMILTLYFFVKGWMVVTGDSYFFLNWSHDPILSLELGYPLVLLSIANLSTLIGPDYFLYVIFPLTTLSLALLIILITKNICEKYNYFTDSRMKFLFLILVLLIFSMNPMVHLQMSYANHHTLFAILVLILVMLPFLIQNFNLSHYFFIGILTLFASLTRMEGFLFFLIILVILAYRFKDKLNGFRLLLISFLLTLPYLIFLTVVLWDNGFVSGKQYLFMISFGLIVVMLYRSRKFNELLDGRDPGMIAIYMLSLILLIVTVMEPAHMVQSLIIFARNSITPGAWGALNVLLVILVPLLIFVRLRQSEVKKYYDIFLYVFVISVLLILIVTYFRSPLRIGRFDSANRMLFHFIPLLTVWTSIEVARLLGQKR